MIINSPLILFVGAVLLLGAPELDAFTPKTILKQPTTATALSAALSSGNAPSDDMIRRDIEAMREEARRRLDHLNHDLEDFISHHQDQGQENSSNDKNNELFVRQAFENTDVPPSKKLVVDQPHISKAPISVENIPKQTTAAHLKEQPNQHVVAPPHYFADSKKLHDTRWKIVIQVGTKRQNERYEEKPLHLHLVVDFTSEKLKESDELLQGKSNAKTLVVKEAWIGASSTTEGHQRNIKLKHAGGWKVLPGQGPKGIDILRFYVDVQEEVRHSESSSLRCPAKRVYCTAGIFGMEHHSESEHFKDYLRGELDKMVHRYEDLTFQEENDERLLSFDKVKRAKEMMQLRTKIRDMNQKIVQARIRDPEKSMLRLSRKGDIGVTKDGQVCYRETKGMSWEYIVLGQMEMASIHKPLIESTSHEKEGEGSSDELRP